MSRSAGPDGRPVRRLESRADWETWLDANHAVSTGVWINFGKKATGVASVSHSEALDVALCYGWIDGQATGLDDGWWLQRFTRRRPGSKWSQINCQKAIDLIAEGKMRPAGLAEVEAAKRDGRWDAAYAPQRSIAVPADLQQKLDASPRARDFFARLDSKNRYAILYRLHDAKKPETRARRLEKFVAMLEDGKKIH
ncbi:MAG TPA: YdeI/OmpD-associated family protein [Gemmatimonadales bacterium]|nr:YdeI/OmpD-associated family protein [Gemmatimonadales bacterium]